MLQMCYTVVSKVSTLKTTQQAFSIGLKAVDHAWDFNCKRKCSDEVEDAIKATCQM